MAGIEAGICMGMGNHISGLLMLGLVAPALAQTTATIRGSEAQFSDPSTGVSFAYPKYWQQTAGSQFYLGLNLIPEKAEVRGAVAWKANADAKTTLAGAQFLYALQKDVSFADCMHPHNEGDATDSTVNTVKIRGVAYAHSRAEDAAMCHHQKEDVYATYRYGACYLFDFSVRTLCPGVVDGMREATPAELADMDARLLGILKTVQIGKPEAAAVH